MQQSFSPYAVLDEARYPDVLAIHLFQLMRTLSAGDIASHSSRARSPAEPNSLNDGEQEEHGLDEEIGRSQQESQAVCEQALNFDELGQLADQVMQRSNLFYALDRTVTRAFLRHASQLTLQSGEHLYAEDEDIEVISVVRSGSLVLYRAAEEEGTIGQVRKCYRYFLFYLFVTCNVSMSDCASLTHLEHACPGGTRGGS